MQSLIVDVHAHIFPDRVSQFLPKISIGPIGKWITQDRVEMLRRNARNWLGPISRSIHHAQPVLRHFPEPMRKSIDSMSALAPLPSLFVESTVNDLKEAMDTSQVKYTVLIAHPPMSSNELILDVCSEDPRLIPAVNIPSGTARPGQTLKRFHERGAKLLKIHGAADGEGVDSPRYRSLLKAASELEMPVILHTGCIHSKLLYKDPVQGHAQRYSPWFAQYPETQFILAHMNFHEPIIAMDLAEEFPNVHLDTSWQPTEVIGEAVRRVGPARVMFGTDWPFLGQNQAVGIARIRACVEAGMMSAEDVDLLLGKNAIKLLKLKQL